MRKKPGEILADSGLLPLLFECHDSGAPFFFRIEVRSTMSPDEKTAFVKKVAAVIEEKTDRQLINSATDYEVELRLIQTRSGRFFPCVKLQTIPMKRFAYRKMSIAGIDPSRTGGADHAAGQALFKRGRADYGSVLRSRHDADRTEQTGTGKGDVRNRSVWRGDRESEREHTERGDRIWYINRDFFDFTHDYKFDEIITDMPPRGKKTKEEQDAFYAALFCEGKRAS